MGALILLMAEVPGATDLQSIRANWFRLHTTDAAMALFSGAHILAVIAIERVSGKGRMWAVGCLSAALLIIAVMMKPTAICLAAPLLVYGVLRWAGGERKSGKITLVVGVISFIISALLLFLIVSAARKANPGAYGQSYSLTYDNLRSGAAYFVGAWWRVLGPVSIWLFLSLTFRNLIYWNRRVSLREIIGKNAASLYLILCWMFLTSVYVPWPHHLPRYLVTGLVPLAGLVALECAHQVDLLITWKLRVRTVVASMVAGMLAMLALPLTVLGGAFIVLFYASRRKPSSAEFTAWSIAGMGIVGFAYLLVIGLISAKAMEGNYCEREFQQNRLTTAVGSECKSRHTVGFLGDAADEHVGSMCGKLSREGIEPRIQGIKDIGETSRFSKLLFSKALSPSDLTPDPQTWVGTEVFGPDNPVVYVPLDFWTWRRRVWQRESIEITEPQSLNWDWILYAKK